ncbi:MAG TPA: hypothetical protein VH867_04510 [Burkholderiales bacterium]|jgi:hypothetical protein
MFARLMPHEGRFFTEGRARNIRGVAGNIVWVWIFTIPRAAFIAWLLATEYF